MVPKIPHKKRQGGAVAIMVGFSIFVLVGMLGLVLDLGRMFIIKTELQNGVDACALAAARELTGDANSLERAEAAGILVGGRNRVDFQKESETGFVVEFSEHLATGYASKDSADPLAVKYVKCSLPRSGIVPWFMGVMGEGQQTVSAMAVASRVPAQINCAIPLGLCSNPSPPANCPDGSAPDVYGLCVGEWRNGKFGAGDGAGGAFNWLQFPGMASGAQGVIDALTGTGDCSLAIHDTVPAETGNLGNAGAKAWNSRFGLYQPACDPVGDSTCPKPDFTGYTYTPTTWPPQYNALSDFQAKRAINAPYQGDAATGLNLPGGYQHLSTAQHAAAGADRRLVTVPIVDCATWGSGHVADLLNFACVLMIRPVVASGDVYMEYRGVSNLPGSPCATSGLAGGTVGPLVPTLVQ